MKQRVLVVNKLVSKALGGWRSGVRSLPPALCIFLFLFRLSHAYAGLQYTMHPHPSKCQMTKSQVWWSKAGGPL